MTPPPPPASAAAVAPAELTAGGLLPRALLAALFTPVLGYWLPMRGLELAMSGGLLAGGLLALLLLVPTMMAGAWAAVAGAMRVGRDLTTKPLVPAIEELLAALLGLTAPQVPGWFGLSLPGGLGMALALQGAGVFLALVVMGGGLGGSALLPPLQVGPIRPGRELAVRAMVAALLPTTLLYALLPLVVLGSDVVALASGDFDSLTRRVLIAWTSATLAGVALGMGAFREGRPPYLEKPEQVLIAAAGMALAVASWLLGGGLHAHPALFLFQPVCIFVAAVVLGARREAHDERVFGGGGGHRADGPDGLLVPPGAAIPYGRTDTRHAGPSGVEVRTEARWMVPRPLVAVADEYRGRHGLAVRAETDAEVLLTRAHPTPGAVRLTARPPVDAGPDGVPGGPRTEVTVRLAAPA